MKVKIRDCSLSSSEKEVLEVIESFDGAISTHALTKITGMDKGAMKRALDKLVKKDKIVKATNVSVYFWKSKG